MRRVMQQHFDQAGDPQQGLNRASPTLRAAQRTVVCNRSWC
ncbi:MAG: hypothetical protein ACK55I_13960 [bacterium]